VEKIIRENVGEKRLEDALNQKNVSDATIRLLCTFMGEIDRRLISKFPYLRVKTHDRGLTYFPSTHNRPKGRGDGHEIFTFYRSAPHSCTALTTMP
jgi:hypothetical protein